MNGAPRPDPRHVAAPKNASSEAGPLAPSHAAANPHASAAIVFGLIALAAFIFLQTRSFGFVNFDDPTYIAINDWVREGLSWSGVAWAFTTFHAGNWHPLTWLSLMLDVQLAGVNPGFHHLVNGALHAVNAILVFAVLRASTSSRWRSALVAALFAVHPLHVESVAWISERKDLLSAFFGLLCIGAHVRYARAPSPRRYLATAGALVLGLASKPMLVTIPLVLLLVDQWPLRRSEPLRSLIREKIPFFVVAAASSLVTVAAQKSGAAVSTLEFIPVSARAGNAIVAYAVYLWKTVWPASLAVVYPHPAATRAGLSPAWIALSLTALIAISVLAAWQWRARPWIAVGWAWFIVTLVPVIGLVQVGMQAYADRYTYLPLIGIFVALAWTLPHAAGRSARAAIVAGCIAAIAASTAVARAQTVYWRDSITLFEHALAETRDNAAALRNLGVAHVERGEYLRGVAELRESLRIVPGDAWAWMDLGIGLSLIGDGAGANSAFSEAFRLRPDDADVLYNIGVFAVTQGRLDVARSIHARLQRVSPRLAGKLAMRLGLPQPVGAP